jgi:ABC-type nitrate/sulfonate/bicarbonate transport system substrate-binding protein
MWTRRKFLAGASGALATPFIGTKAFSQSTTIPLAWIRQFAPAAIVQKQMEFARAGGLNLELISFNRGLDGMVALQKGDVVASDILVNFSHFCMALAQGADFTVVSGSCQGLNEILISPSLVPAAELDKKNLAYTGGKPWELMKGKSVGCARGSHQEFILRLFLRKNGMDIDKDIKFIDLKSNTDQALALKQGSVDIALITEPTSTQARLDGYGILLTHGYEGNEFTKLNSPLIVRTDFMNKSPDVVQKLVDAHVKAIQHYHADRAAWAADTAAVTLFSKETLTYLMNPQSLGLDPKYWANVSLSWELPLESIKKLSSGLAQAGFIPQDVTDKVVPRIEYRFLEKATGKSKAELGA